MACSWMMYPKDARSEDSKETLSRHNAFVDGYLVFANENGCIGIG